MTDSSRLRAKMKASAPFLLEVVFRYALFESVRAPIEPLSPPCITSREPETTKQSSLMLSPFRKTKSPVSEVGLAIRMSALHEANLEDCFPDNEMMKHRGKIRHSTRRFLPGALWDPSKLTARERRQPSEARRKAEHVLNT